MKILTKLKGESPREPLVAAMVMTGMTSEWEWLTASPAEEWLEYEVGIQICGREKENQVKRRNFFIYLFFLPMLTYGRLYPPEYKFHRDFNQNQFENFVCKMATISYQR